MPINYYIFIAFLILAVILDLRYRSIPNILTLGGALAGFAISFHIFGLVGLELSFFGAVIAGCIGWLFWSAGLVGGGDQKLLFTVGSFLWYPLILDVLVYIGILGGVLALLWTFAESYFSGTKFLTVIKYSHIPYSLAILLGTLIVIV